MKVLKSFDLGILECWSTGVLKENIIPSANNSTLQYSKITKFNNLRPQDGLPSFVWYTRKIM